MLNSNNTKIAIIGLGYVGLPLAVEFGKHYITLGFDINASRINELKSGLDSTLETNTGELASAKYLSYSFNVDDLNQFKETLKKSFILKNLPVL